MLSLDEEIQIRNGGDVSTLGAQTSPFSPVKARARDMMDAANIGDYLGIYGLCKTGDGRPATE